MARDEFAGAIVFSIICLLIGKVVDFILSHTKIPIPSTVFLFYFGVTLGVITFHVDAHIPKFLEVSAFSSTLIVYGFLPILLFSEAMTLNRHHLYQYLGCATYLAGM